MKSNGIGRHGPITLTARDVTKSFGTVLANDRVSLTLGGGEIVGLVGENGAGKSTLLSILAGFLRLDSGTLAVAGQTVSFASPADALSAGIGLVHQHLSLVPSFTVREQLALAGWDSSSMPGILAGDFGGDEIIEHLAMGRRQRVEIARVLIGNPRVLLLDEPTSILAPSEVGALFDVLRDLRRAGIAIAIVTHKLREVMTLADRIVVMAGGKVTGSFRRGDDDWPPYTEREMLRRMFAWAKATDSPALEPPAGVSRPPAAGQPPLLRVSGLSAAPQYGSRALTDIGFDLVAGQLNALVGIDGQGQTELAGAVAGYRASAGVIVLEGQDIQGLPPIVRAGLGIGLLVDDRLGEAAIGTFSVSDNLVLKRPRPRALVRNGFFRRRAVHEHARSVIDAWGIEPADPDARFGTLSGGNMQRVLAARELDREPRVLIALNPVQGLDARTAAFLWNRLRALCERGGTVLVFTTDLDEAFAQADRCGVIFAGRVSPLAVRELADRDRYGEMMVNGW